MKQNLCLIVICIACGFCLWSNVFRIEFPIVSAADNVKNSSATLIDEGFDNSELIKRGWYDGSKFAIVETSPFKGKGCIEYQWNEKTTVPASSSGMRHLIQPSETIYLRCYLRLSKDWGWSGRAYHPHLMHFLTTENQKYAGPAASHLTVYIEPWNGKLRLATQDIQNKDQPHGLTQGPLKGGYNGQMFDSKQVLFADDKWHCIEALFQLNSLDLQADQPNSDGIVQGWVDGELVIDKKDIVLRSTDFPKMKFNQFLLTPYFGPGLLPHAQSLWIDELVIATKRPDEVGTEIGKHKCSP